MQEEELDRLVNEAAAKMISAANKERGLQPRGRSMLHDVRAHLLAALCGVVQRCMGQFGR
jgi:hypothetical protein